MTNAHENPAPPLPQAIPMGLVCMGIVVGLVLIFLGMGLIFYDRGTLLSSLMTCVGFGIVLASFGAKASGAWAGWTVSGAGALAIVLFLVLQHYTLQPSAYKKGQVAGNLSRIADLRIIDELPTYLYRDKTTSSIRFVLLERKLRTNRLRIQVDTTEKGDGKEFFELVGDASKIYKRYLAEGTDPDRQIQWEFDYNKRQVKDGADIIFSEQDDLRSTPPLQSGALEWPVRFDFGPSRAHAQESTTTNLPVANLINKLQSDDTSERRNARDELSALGPPAIKSMMTALRSDPSNYRIRLGVVFALADMLQRNATQRPAISAALVAEDFPLLVAAASDDDKTIRYQAATFLYLLQDPRVVQPSVTAARSAPDTNKATNQVLIIKQSGQSLSSTDKSRILNDLIAGPGRNNDLVNSSAMIKNTLGW